MARLPETPFDSIENAQDYIRLLLEAILEAKHDIELDLASVSGPRAERRLEALRLVQFKLGKLSEQLKGSSRLLNDLRTLRRLLLEERLEIASATVSDRTR